MALVLVVVAGAGPVAVAESKPASVTSSLKAAAEANAKAWLSGTPDEIKKFQGPECTSKKSVDVTSAEKAVS